MLQIEITEHHQIIVNGEVKGEIDFKIEDDPAIRQIVKRVDLHEELIKAIEMEIWAAINGESEAQKQGKPRLSERIEILNSLLEKATK